MGTALLWLVLKAGSLVEPTTVATTPAEPLTSEHRTQISAAVKNVLSDWDAVRFVWPAPRGRGLYCGWINVKGSFGGSSGFYPYLVVGNVKDRRGAKSQYVVTETKLGTGRQLAQVLDICRKHGFDVSRKPTKWVPGREFKRDDRPS